MFGGKAGVDGENSLTADFAEDTDEAEEFFIRAIRAIRGLEFAALQQGWPSLRMRECRPEIFER